MATTIQPRLEPVDDVEVSAGRTMRQQQLHGDFDDDCSTSSSIGSDFHVTTMWDDWGSSLKQQYLQEELDLERREDMEVQAHIDRVLKERDEGLECLLDFVDNLDLDDDVRVFDDDADDWSQPASSILGGIRSEELDESLLFEI